VTKFAMLLLAGIAMLQFGLSVAGDTAADSRAKPNSFVPHAATNQHVYGAPIEPPIMGHSKVSHAKKTPKRRSLRPQKKG
jgi:hypothetical protein